MTISLDVKNVCLQAPIGITEAERRSGTKLCISVSLKYTPPGNAPYQLENLIDYEAVRRLIVNEAQHPEKLLENLAQRILKKLLGQWPQLQHCQVTVVKQQFSGAFPTASAAITFTWPTP